MTTTDRWRGGRTAWTLGAALALVAGACLGGCGSSSPRAGDGTGTPSAGHGREEPADPVSHVERPDARFDASVRVTQDHVAVTYSLRNTSARPLLVLDRVPRFDASGRVTFQPGNAYVTGAAENQQHGAPGRVMISKRLFPRPAGVERVMDPSVGGTVLAPGRTVHAAFHVPRPLRRHHPYGDDSEDGRIRLPDPVRSVVFCLGVVPEPFPEAIRLQLRNDPDHRRLILHGDAAAAAQYLFCSAPASAR